ncbi:mucin-1-like [Hyalella azteca]|uniref:Mucin-1-like n=1 Tax=Hyalella azteca TaxID=294128 RepID=A0A979FNW6_HYAAZ|nr:mucin-1-like [Hyalella azteca]
MVDCSVWKSELEAPTRCPLLGRFRGALPDAPGYCATLTSDCRTPDVMTYVVTQCVNTSLAYEHPIPALTGDLNTPPRPLDSIPPPLPPEIQVSYLPVSNSSRFSSRTPTEIVVSSSGGQGSHIVRLPPPEMTSTVNLHSGSSSPKKGSIPGTISLLPSDNRVSILGGAVQSNAPSSRAQEISVSSNYPSEDRRGVIGAHLTIGEPQTVRVKRSDVTAPPRVSRAKTTVISFRWDARPTTRRTDFLGETTTERLDNRPQRTGSGRSHPPSLPPIVDARQNLPSPPREEQFSASIDPGSRRPYSWPTNNRGDADSSFMNPSRRPVTHSITEPPFAADDGGSSRAAWITEVDDERGERFNVVVSRGDSFPGSTSSADENPLPRNYPPLNHGVGRHRHTVHRHGSTAPFSFNSRVPEAFPPAHDVDPSLGGRPSPHLNDRRLPALHDTLDLPRTVDLPSSSNRKPPSSFNFDIQDRRTIHRPNKQTSNTQRFQTTTPSVSNQQRGSNLGVRRFQSSNDGHQHLLPTKPPLRVDLNTERDYRCIGEWREDDHVYALTYRPDTHTHECFVGTETRDGHVYVKEAGGVAGACARGVRPDVMGMLLVRKGSQQQPKTGSQQEPKTGSQRKPKTGSQQEPKTGSQQEMKTGPQYEPKTGSQQEPKTGSQQEPKTGSQKEPKTGSQQEQKTGSQQEPKTGSQQEPNTGSQQGPNTGSQQEPKTGSQRN